MQVVQRGVQQRADDEETFPKGREAFTFSAVVDV